MSWGKVISSSVERGRWRTPCEMVRSSRSKAGADMAWVWSEGERLIEVKVVFESRVTVSRLASLNEPIDSQREV